MFIEHILVSCHGLHLYFFFHFSSHKPGESTIVTQHVTKDLAVAWF